MVRENRAAQFPARLAARIDGSCDQQGPLPAGHAFRLDLEALASQPQIALRFDGNHNARQAPAQAQRLKA